MISDPSKTLKALLIGTVWPEAESSAAGLRVWNILDTLKGADWELAFACPSPFNKYSEKLNASGITTTTLQANDPQFDVFIRELNPDFVIFDRFIMEEQFGWRIEEHSPKTVRVLDTSDLHFLRRAREEALKRGCSLEDVKNCDFDLITESTLRELGSILRSDTALIISDFELNLLISQFQIHPKHLLLSRFMYPPPDPSPDFESRSDFMMIGNFRHAPNTDGIRWFRKEIWPLIRKSLPSVNVHIYGAYPPKEMMELTDRKTGFIVEGPVESQFEVLKKHRINLAPLRFGAGIKGKITDGWSCGTPVITTPIGAEGMCDDLPFAGEVALSPEEFAQKAVTLYQNEEIWNAHQKSGYTILERLYTRDAFASPLINHLISLKMSLETKRKNNLMGAILRHHLHKSTKYFSKWIEIKNQKPEN